MSGIYGIINRDARPVESVHFAALADALSHRAVDDQQHYLHDHVGLGCALMHVSPESRYEQQPLQYQHWLMVLDGRLFNRSELLKKMAIEFAERAAMPDSLLVMKAYEKWGDNCVNHLRGEYAFLIYNTQSQEIYASQDHFGNRSFFYYFDGQRFCFASELRALLNLPFISDQVDTNYSLFHTLFVHISNGERTFFKQVNTIPRAHYLTVRNGELKQQRYWSPSSNNPLHFSSDREYADCLRHTIEVAVQDRLRIDGGVGVALSGGLDSATVTCIAARQLATQNKTLTASGFVPSPENYGALSDERSYIEAVIQQEKNIVFEPVTITAPTAEYRQDYLSKYALPPHFGSHSWQGVFQQLQKNKARVMLTGFLGDDVISRPGKLVYRNLIHHRKWSALLQVIKARTKATSRTMLAVLTAEALRHYMPEFVENSYAVLKRGAPIHEVQHSQLLHQLLQDQFASTQRISALLEQVNNSLSAPTIADSITNILNDTNALFAAGLGIPAHHHQLIASHPLSDVRVVELAMSMPAEKWLMNGQSRGLIREATKGLLPELVRLRTSKGFIMEEECLYFQKELNHYLKWIQASQSELWQYVNKEALLATLKNYQDTPKGVTFRVTDTLIQLLHFISFFNK